MQPPHGVDEQAVPLLLQGVDLNDQAVQRLGFLEIGKLLHDLLEHLAAADDHLGELLRLRPDGMYIVNINADQHVLDLVRDLVNALTEQNDVLPLNGRDKRLHQHRHHLVLFLVRVVLDLVQLVQILRQTAHIKIRQVLLQHLRRLAAALHALDKILKIVIVALLRHVLLSP